MTDIHAHVVDRPRIGLVGGVEHQVAGPSMIQRDEFARAVLVVRDARDCDAGLGVCPHHQT